MVASRPQKKCMFQRGYCYSKIFGELFRHNFVVIHPYPCQYHSSMNIVHPDRCFMTKLYEQWLSSGEDWLKSSLVINNTKNLSSRRRGRYVMKTYKALKDLYGAAIAKGLRDSKRELQNNKPVEDTNCYWMENPDLPGREDC